MCSVYTNFLRSSSTFSHCKRGGGRFLTVVRGETNCGSGILTLPLGTVFLSWKRTICYLDILHATTYKRYLFTIKMFHRVTFIFYRSCSDKELHIRNSVAGQAWRCDSLFCNSFDSMFLFLLLTINKTNFHRIFKLLKIANFLFLEMGFISF